jgi:hypothetical protein
MVSDANKSPANENDYSQLNAPTAHLPQHHGDNTGAYDLFATPHLRSPATLPLDYDILIDFSPHCAPFLQRVRPTMTHEQLRTLLAIVTGTSPLMFFMFLNHQMRHGNDTLLGDLPPIYPGSTIRLIKWSFFDARRYFDAYNAIPHAEDRTSYWDFNTARFVRLYPPPHSNFAPVSMSNTMASVTDPAPAFVPDNDKTTSVPIAHAVPSPLKSNGKFYAVKRGRIPGIYYSWPECARQVQGYSNAVHRSFRSEAEALLFLHEASDLQIVGASGDDAPYRHITTAEQRLRTLNLNAKSDSSFILLDSNVATAVLHSPLRANEGLLWQH